MTNGTGGKREGGLRAIARDAARDRIAAVTLDLVLEYGFDAVTVEQIATEVGISPRTFHRYFPAKEDAVIGEAEQWLAFLTDTLAARPAGESAWRAVRETFELMMGQASNGDDDDRSRAGMRVVMTTPALRARNYEKHLGWTAELAPLVAARLPTDDAEREAAILVQTALACFDSAMEAWAQSTETRSAAEILEATFDTLELALRRK